jgi:hypothetical protein
MLADDSFSDWEVIVRQKAMLEAEEASIVWSIQPVVRSGRTLWARILQWLAGCQERWAAEVLCAELSKLSDAELERRGIARGDLHRQVFETVPPKMRSSRSATTDAENER